MLALAAVTFLGPGLARAQEAPSLADTTETAAPGPPRHAAPYSPPERAAPSATQIQSNRTSKM